MKFLKVMNAHPLSVELLSYQNPSSSADQILSFLRRCFQQGADIATCRGSFGLLILHGLDSISKLGDYLIRLFTKCGSLQDADQMYVKIACPSIYTWNAIIAAHAKLGDGRTAIALFYHMKESASYCIPDRVTFLILLKASHSVRDIWEGMHIHDCIVRSDYKDDHVIGNTLVDMYSKCGCIDEASHTFNRLQCKDLVSWTAMIGGYAELGHGLSGLELFQNMLCLGMAPCSITYLNTLQACIDVKSLTFGREVHNAIVKSNMESDIALASCLIDMYCKCCSVVEARRVFDFLPKRNIVSWGSMISGYVQQLHSTSALELFADMQQEGIDPDPLIYCDILKAYGKLKSLEQGKLIHKKIASSGLTVNAMLMTSLIDFYGKCGRMEEAHAVFEQSGKREEMLWSALLTGYVENEQMGAAFVLYECMLQKDICPNTLMFLSILRACASLETLVPSRLVHDQIIKAGLNADLVLATVIIDVYVKLSSLGEGCSVLETLPNADTVSWTTLILGYAEQGEAGSALELLDKMQQSGVTPDSVSFLCLLKACSSRKTLMLGRLVHDKIIRFDFLSDSLIGNALVDMYVMCGNLEDGHNVLDGLPSRTVVSWSTLISGYVEINDGCTALQLFEKMQHDDIEPNEVTLLYMLKACAITGVLETGKWMHDKVIRKDMMYNMLLGSCVVEMYAVCGSLEEARRVFDLLPFQDAVSWGAMISGYAQNGCFIAAVKCLSEMQQQGLKANAVVFASILTACCNVGFVYEGWRYLMTMHHHFGIEPGVEHYSCMVDLLGRTGYLSDAARLLESMPVLPNIIGWTALLGSCRRHGNMDLAMQCFNNALKLDLIDASSYLLLSSIFNDYQTQELEDFMPDQRIDWGIR